MLMVWDSSFLKECWKLYGDSEGAIKHRQKVFGS